MIKNLSKLVVLLSLFFNLSAVGAQNFVMGDMQIVNRHGEKLYAQIPLHGMAPDSYSTLSGQVVGFDERINFLDFSFKSKGPEIYFVITSSKPLTNELPVQVFLSYKGSEKNAEYIIVPPTPPVIETPASVSSLQPNALRPSGSFSDSVDELKYIEFSKQSAVIDGSRIVLPFRYEIKPGDSISTIINRYTNPYNASFHHSVLAMYHYNFNAFQNGDINRLIVGETLIVPSIENFFAIDRSFARQNYYALIKGERVAHELLVNQEALPQQISNKNAVIDYWRLTLC